jgi:folate-binding protein YgfZ
MMAMLDRFVIMDDVELVDASADWAGVQVAGPGATELLGKIGFAVDGLEPLAMRSAEWGGATVRLARGHGPLAPRYELWGDEAVVARMFEAAAGAGALECGTESLEWLRVLEGTPRYGVDIRERELPQETGQTRALHFAKGCYLGQEIVERIRSRGNVHRTFSGFRLEGELPGAGAALEAEGKAVGELTSVAAIALPDGRVETVALGYVRREAVERGLELKYDGGVAVPASLPFLRAAALEQRDASESF